jgi:hypothetical protein
MEFVGEGLTLIDGFLFLGYFLRRLTGLEYWEYNISKYLYYK